jgi:ABC-2 type transport system permease protein
MKAQLRAELLKQRTTRTDAALLAAMAGLVALVVALHAFTLPAADIATPSIQLTEIFGCGERFGALFAALAGAMSITNEIRHGTIRPTFLITAHRQRVVAAKAVAAMATGAAFGLIAALAAAGVGSAALAAAGVGSAALAARDVANHLLVGDYALPICGAAAAAALWAAIGVGVGASIRSQVPAVVGITAWLLLVEGLLVDSVTSIGRLAPGAAGMAFSGLGSGTLLAPVIGALLLAAYTSAAIAAGCLTTNHRDVA